MIGVWYGTILAILATINFFTDGIGILPYVLTVLGGTLFWTLFEYLMHRYVFHLPNWNEAAKRFQYIAHGIHHDYPRDKERLFMPPLAGLGLVVALYLIFILLLQNYTLAFVSGMIVGYLSYSYVHFTIHTETPPKFLKKVQVHHALHHYKYPNKAFGVSSPLWDYIFRTMPPKESKSTGTVVGSQNS